MNRVERAHKSLQRKEKRESLGRVLAVILEASEAASGPDCLRNLDQLGNDKRKSKSIEQAWRRWTTGTTRPPLARAARIVRNAKPLGWLAKVEKRDLNLIRELLGKSGREKAPLEWDARYPLGAYQPRETTERDAWGRRLKFVKERVVSFVLVEMEKQVRKETEGPVEASLSKQPQGFVMALFRATMNEISCSMIELMDKRVEVAHAKQGDASFFNTRSEWPSLLRATGSDLSAMLSEVARAIATGGNPADAADRARARLLAHPGAPGIGARNTPNR